MPFVVSSILTTEASEAVLATSRDLVKNVKGIMDSVDRERSDLVEAAQNSVKTVNKLSDEVKTAAGALTGENQSGQVTPDTAPLMASCGYNVIISFPRRSCC